MPAWDRRVDSILEVHVKMGHKVRAGRGGGGLRVRRTLMPGFGRQLVSTIAADEEREALLKELDAILGGFVPCAEPEAADQEGRRKQAYASAGLRSTLRGAANPVLAVLGWKYGSAWRITWQERPVA
jgi:hypothetical protein